MGTRYTVLSQIASVYAALQPTGNSNPYVFLLFGTYLIARRIARRMYCAVCCSIALDFETHNLAFSVRRFAIHIQVVANKDALNARRERARMRTIAETELPTDIRS